MIFLSFTGNIFGLVKTQKSRVQCFGFTKNSKHFELMIHFYFFHNNDNHNFIIKVILCFFASNRFYNCMNLSNIYEAGNFNSTFVSLSLRKEWKLFLDFVLFGYDKKLSYFQYTFIELWVSTLINIFGSFCFPSFFFLL